MIPFFDPTREYLAHRDEYLDTLDRVLARGQWILGPEVEAFEREFGEYLGVRHAVGVNSGTDALILALTALGIGPGDEVITVANSAVATVAAVRAVGAIPRFVDLLPGQLVMDPRQAARAVMRRTRCLLPVHLHGCPAPIDELLDVASRHGLYVVEDCAQGHGALYRGRPVGTFGHVGCFSFYPTKNLGACGDGGMCVTNDASLELRLRRLRNYGVDVEGIARLEGRNSRLDELQAALLRRRLDRLDAAVERRRELAARYLERLMPMFDRLPVDPTDGRHAYHHFVVRSRERQVLSRRLTAHGIGFAVHYPCPVHLMSAFSLLGYREGDFPVTEAAADEVLSLPLFPELTDAEVDRVVEALTFAATPAECLP